MKIIGKKSYKLFNVLVRKIEIYRLELTYRTTGITGVAHELQHLRNPIYALRRWGADIGQNTLIYPGIIIHAAQDNFSKLHIGSDVRIVRDCLIDLTDEVHIEDKAIISFRCNLITHHNIHKSSIAQTGYPPAQAPIIIKRGAVLFTNVTVLIKITIKKCAMVAARAVVTSDVPDWTLVGGIPSRVIKRIKN
jgi:acetyltransferase-like isoleucine patch superfamily enzyme